MVLAALRGENVGNDTEEYLNIFKTYQNNPDAETRYEIGFVWLNKISALIWSNPQIIIIVSSIFIFYSYGRFISKYSKIPWLSLFIFFTYGYYAFAISGIRQSIAIAIILFSYKYIIDGKFLKFLLIVLFASLFHTTALLFLPAYFTRKLKIRMRTILIIIFAGFVSLLAFASVMKFMFTYFTAYEHYNSSIYSGETRLASILYVIVSLLIVVFAYKTLKQYHNYSRDVYYVNGNMILLVCIASALYILSLNLNIFDRVALYYNVFAIAVLPNAISRLKPDTRLISTVSVVLFFFAYAAIIIMFRPIWNSSFPYSFFSL